MAKVRFLKHDQIEDAALCLLAEYGRKYGEVSEPPVPVEEILSAHLGLTLDFDDLPTRLGTPDVLGATWIADKLVIVDQSLAGPYLGKAVKAAADADATVRVRLEQ